MAWSPENVAQLRLMWRDRVSLTTAKIAQALPGITRAAVEGKLFRMRGQGDLDVAIGDLRRSLRAAMIKRKRQAILDGMSRENADQIFRMDDFTEAGT